MQMNYSNNTLNAAIAAGNVNIASKMEVEVLELSSESRAEQLQHAASIRKLEEKKRARSVYVPTDIKEVKLRLRELGHPTTLFGEVPFDRRERLRIIVAALEMKEEESAKVSIKTNCAFSLKCT